jgi:hypothetical protein
MVKANRPRETDRQHTPAHTTRQTDKARQGKGRARDPRTVVSARSYSYISGSTSEETETGVSGISRSSTSRTRCSCSPLTYALRRHTVTASTRSRLSTAICSSRWSVSRGRTTFPSASMRSRTSTVDSRGARSSPLFHTMKAARPPGTKERSMCRIWR